MLVKSQNLLHSCSNLSMMLLIQIWIIRAVINHFKYIVFFLFHDRISFLFGYQLNCHSVFYAAINKINLFWNCNPSMPKIKIGVMNHSCPVCQLRFNRPPLYGRYLCPTTHGADKRDNPIANGGLWLLNIEEVLRQISLIQTDGIPIVENFLQHWEGISGD